MEVAEMRSWCSSTIEAAGIGVELLDTGARGDNRNWAQIVQFHFYKGFLNAVCVSKRFVPCERRDVYQAPRTYKYEMTRSD